MSTPHIIHTIEELQDLDPETLLLGEELPTVITMVQVDWLTVHWMDRLDIFPLAVIATGEQVRAARKALEGES